jgi:hypothetical protein
MMGGVVIGIRTRPIENNISSNHRYTEPIGSKSALPLGTEAYTYTYKRFSTFSTSEWQ